MPRSTRLKDKTGSAKLTSGQSNLTQDHIAAADGRFNRIRQVAHDVPSHVGKLAPPGEYD